MRKLNKAESLVIVKFFYKSLNLVGPNLATDFWEITQAEMTQGCNLMNMQQIPDLEAPFSRSLVMWRKVLQYLKSYLSNANLESPLDLWARDEEGGDRIREREALIAFAEDNDDSSVSSLKKVAGGLHSMTDY